MVGQENMIEFDIHYDEENDCLIGSCTGRLDSNTVQSCVEQIGNMASKHACKRFLNDLRKAEIDLTVLQLYTLAEALVTANSARSWRPALLVSEQARGAARFFETVAQNRGYLVRLFFDQDEAMEWLKSAR